MRKKVKGVPYGWESETGRTARTAYDTLRCEAEGVSQNRIDIHNRDMPQQIKRKTPEVRPRGGHSRRELWRDLGMPEQHRQPKAVFGNLVRLTPRKEHAGGVSKLSGVPTRSPKQIDGIPFPGKGNSQWFNESPKPIRKGTVEKWRR
jgi:hypothetical protein